MSKSLIASLVIASVSIVAAPAFAGNAGQSHGACYDHVMDACASKTGNAYNACINSGMNACDKLHSGSGNNNQSNVNPNLRGGVQNSVRVRN
ncbi:MAG: hypothetical protein KDJ77_02015 [Rhodobiaceae bacterium]|nr:hypothetical protein [Rhodobiaceae bacterium]